MFELRNVKKERNDVMVPFKGLEFQFGLCKWDKSMFFTHTRTHEYTYYEGMLYLSLSIEAYSRFV